MRRSVTAVVEGEPLVSQDRVTPQHSTNSMQGFALPIPAGVLENNVERLCGAAQCHPGRVDSVAIQCSNHLDLQK